MYIDLVAATYQKFSVGLCFCSKAPALILNAVGGGSFWQLKQKWIEINGDNSAVYKEIES